jgi:N-acyl-D-amino-acid deacylase
MERVYDQPGGADRVIVRSTGIEHVWVNGTAIRTAGEDLDGVAPGRLIRTSGAQAARSSVV